MQYVIIILALSCDTIWYIIITRYTCTYICTESTDDVQRPVIIQTCLQDVHDIVISNNMTTCLYTNMLHTTCIIHLTMVTHHNCVSVMTYIWCMRSYLLAPVISYNPYLWWEPWQVLGCHVITSKVRLWM